MVEGRPSRKPKKFGGGHVVASSEDKELQLPRRAGRAGSSTECGLRALHANETIAAWKSLDPSNTAACRGGRHLSSTILSRPWTCSKYGRDLRRAQKNIGRPASTIVIVRDDLVVRRERHADHVDYKTHADNESMYNTPHLRHVHAGWCSSG